MLYHYTDIESAGDIIRDGVIRATRIVLYRDMMPDPSRSREIGPLVWLTINPILDGTVLAKMRAVGWTDIMERLAWLAVERCTGVDRGVTEWTDITH